MALDSITQLEKIQELKANHRTPFFVTDLSVLEERVRELRTLFPKFKLYYSLKANPELPVLVKIHSLSVPFDAATMYEINKVLRVGADPKETFFNHPFKDEEHIIKARDLGVKWFTFDTEEELEKILELVPNPSLLLRIKPPLKGTFYDFSEKFGAGGEKILELLQHMKRKGISDFGFVFHVGSQNTSPENWLQALDFCKEIIGESGMKPKVINMGGGWPASYLSSSADISEIARQVNKKVEELFPDTEMVIEPGRFLVAETTTLVTKVKAVVQREKSLWVIIDGGVFSGLIESLWHVEYPIESMRTENPTEVCLAGHTLDGEDIINRKLVLPLPKVGDYLFVRNCGAYSTSFFTEFHSIPKPMIYYLD